MSQVHVQHIAMPRMPRSKIVPVQLYHNIGVGTVEVYSLSSSNHNAAVLVFTMGLKTCVPRELELVIVRHKFSNALYKSSKQSKSEDFDSWKHEFQSFEKMLGGRGECCCFERCEQVQLQCRENL